MSKKEFYEKYIKDKRTEDEKMLDIIHENARKPLEDSLYYQSANCQNRGVYESHKVISIGQLIVIILLIVLVIALWT